MLVRTLRIKYIIYVEVHLLVICIFLELINARKMEHIKTRMTFLTPVLWVTKRDRTPKEKRDVLEYKDTVDEINTNETESQKATCKENTIYLPVNGEKI
jgi:hypothetical protein